MLLRVMDSAQTHWIWRRLCFFSIPFAIVRAS